MTDTHPPDAAVYPPPSNPLLDRAAPPPLIEVSTFQNEILNEMMESPYDIDTSKELGKRLGHRPQSIGAALQHLQEKGVVKFLAKGVWQVNPEAARRTAVGKKPRKSKPKPKPTKEKIVGVSRSAIGTPTAGDLFELVGSTAQGKLLVRSVEGHIVYAITEL